MRLASVWSAVIAASCWLSTALLAADFSIGSDGSKSITIPKLQQEAKVDGKLDEEVWQKALLIEDFHQYEPVEYSAPSRNTKVWVYYTENALYIGSFFEEPDMSKISANIMRQGQGLASDDILAVVLDPFLDHRNGYRFEVNANGVRWEGLFQNVTEIEGNWDGIWQADAYRVENGWYSEMRIPFQTIAFNPDSDTWGINFRRAIRRNNESVAWVSRNRQVNPGVAGTMKGLTGMKQGIGLDIVPSMSVSKGKTYGPLGVTSSDYEPSLDVFYKITTELNAALTINTDFSAADVDNRQVNLTRFNLFFPEQRDFFIRDSDIFEFGMIGTSNFNQAGGSGNPAVPSAASQNGRPFFSRKIGLSAKGAPVDINYGGKISGRIGEWNVGTLVVRQNEDLSSGVEAKDLVVGRAVLNVLSESQVGVIGTYGDAQSNFDNSLVGVDFRYRNSHLPGGQTLQGVAYYQKTDSELVKGDNASWGVGLLYPASQGWRGGYTYKRVEKNFAPALGFVNQTSVEDHSLDFGHRHFFAPGGYARSLYAGFDGYRANYLDDRTLSSQNFGMRLTGNNNQGDGLFVRLIRNEEVLRSPFTIYKASDGKQTTVLPKGSYLFDEAMVGIDFANQRKLSGRVSIRGGDYYSGTHLLKSIDYNWKITPRYGISGQFSMNSIKLPQGDFTVRLFSLQGLVAFSNKLSWITLFQYDNVSELLGINSRLHYIPEAGKEMFVVFNYGMSDLDKDGNFMATNAELSVKFNYTFRY